MRNSLEDSYPDGIYPPESASKRFENGMPSARETCALL
jgi:hypothetical protein